MAQNLTKNEQSTTSEPQFRGRRHVSTRGRSREDDIDSLEARVDESPILAKSLRINSKRLWRDITYSAQWGAIKGSFGMARLAASEEDKMVRDWFVCEAKAVDCKIEVDQIGNIFAILPGLCSDMAPIAMGSHLDTQPAGKFAMHFFWVRPGSKHNLTMCIGGRFDGILGVLGALEVLRTVRESGRKTYAPLAAVCWTNEYVASSMPFKAFY